MSGRNWNRWSVYEFLKLRFERAGEVPTKQELEAEFVSIDPEELAEGIIEFEIRVSIEVQ